MIGQLQNPSHGFEDVIKAHFYLKKDRILQVNMSFCLGNQGFKKSYALPNKFYSVRRPFISTQHFSIFQEVEEWVKAGKSSKLERAFQNLRQELQKLEPPPNVANLCCETPVVICEDAKTSACLGEPPKDSCT
jgi:hypothetical protein